MFRANLFNYSNALPPSALCPPGEYRFKKDKKGSPADQCKPCATGFFKSARSPAACTAHRKCPWGKYTKVGGSTTTQPQCEACAPGFFKAITSSSGMKTDSCAAHTKCPPGKYTAVIGSATAQPQCKACAAGFYKASTSENSTCIATDSGELCTYPES